MTALCILHDRTVLFPFLSEAISLFSQRCLEKTRRAPCKAPHGTLWALGKAHRGLLCWRYAAFIAI